MKPVYEFNDRRALDVLPNGVTRVYFDEQVKHVTNIVEIEGEKLQTEEYDMYGYHVADIPAGATVDKGAIVNAIIRSQYTQADVEAILRHKVAGVSGAKAEFDAFNAFAEAAKARAVEILGELEG